MSCLTKLECLNCRQHIDETMHRRDGCHYHSGVLQPCGTWMDTDAAQDPQNYQWTCCSQTGANRGCHWGRHQLPEMAITSTRPFGTDTLRPSRGLKRRMSDSDDSDSGMEGRFAGRGCIMEQAGFGSSFMSAGIGAYPAKLRRLDRASMGAVPPNPDAMFT